MPFSILCGLNFLARESCIFVVRIKVPVFEEINKKKPTLLALNMQYSKNLRNTGSFVDEMKVKYKKSDDVIKDCLSDIFNNYNLVDLYVYNRDKSKKCRNMRTFIYRVKG